jgi:hypothetical protein
MSDQSNTVIIVLMFVARCMAPVLLLLGISYLFRRLGLTPEEPPPADFEQENHNLGGQTDA